ncbi:GreA/GreB family elongation factor [bacterium]|nr:GreA/GreB family elongation factor [bacterium]
MKDKKLQDFLDNNQLDDLEVYWLEILESGDFDLQDLLDCAKQLGRRHEKQRAAVLMNLLDEHLREHQSWSAHLRVLKEITRHTLDPKKLDDVKDQFRETLGRVYPQRPTFDSILRFYSVQEILNLEELVPSIEKSEEALRYDIGQPFYQQGYGTGQVTEINLKLRVVRIDFEKKSDVTVQFGDREVLLLKEGHILREKVMALSKLQQEAEADPAGTLGRLLQTFDRPMTVSEIKDCLNNVVTEGSWSRWWTAARKNPQIVTTGKGAQALYSWSGSASEAEEQTKKEFDSAKTKERIATAKALAGRSPELTNHFADVLIHEASNAFETKKWDTALDILDLFQRWPDKVNQLSYTFERILRDANHTEVLNLVENQAQKTKVLMAYRELFPDNWVQIYSQHFFREENPKVLSLMLEKLVSEASESADQVLNRIVASPSLSPAAFTWFCEMAADEKASQLFLSRLDGKFILSVIEAIDATEFSKNRNRIKKAIESGLLMNILSHTLNPDVAQKSMDMLDHTIHLEDYRKDRWKNVIRMRVPEMKKKEDWIFSTREAFEVKRVELENLIKVELPTNRKAIGEAAAHGDLRENHEYKAARERQEYLINRVAALQNELNRVRVLEPGQVDCSEVRPGTRIVLGQPGDKRMVLTLLGPWDSNPQQGIYSYQAKIGTILLGKLPGEKIEWNDENWVVEAIEPWS